MSKTISSTVAVARAATARYAAAARAKSQAVLLAGCLLPISNAYAQWPSTLTAFNDPTRDVDSIGIAVFEQGTRRRSPAATLTSTDTCRLPIRNMASVAGPLRRYMSRRGCEHALTSP